MGKHTTSEGRILSTKEQLNFAIQRAQELKLYVLAEINQGRRGGPSLSWVIFDALTGVQLGMYYPLTSRWIIGDDRGVGTWQAALDIANAIRRPEATRNSAMTQPVSTPAASLLPGVPEGLADDLYCDGGVISKNPSPLGGTYAWVRVRLAANGVEECVNDGSGIVTPLYVSDEKPPISNNYTELLAIVYGLEAMPAGWSGTLYSDSANALTWSKVESVPCGISRTLWNRLIAANRRTGCYRRVRVSGHPTKTDLLRGFTARRGLPVSVWNVRCDKECGRLAKEFLAAKVRELQGELLTKKE